MNPFLQNEHLLLRPMEPEDLDFLYEIENDTTLWQHGVSNVPYSRYTLRQFISESRHDIFTDKQLRLMVTLRNGKETIGCVDLFDFNPMHHRAEIGVLILPSHQGAGYGTQALQLMTDYAFRFLGIHQVYAYVAQSNLQACRSLEAAGFSCSALLADWLYSQEGFHPACFYTCFSSSNLIKNQV